MFTFHTNFESNVLFREATETSETDTVVRRPAVIIQLDVPYQNVEKFLSSAKKKIEGNKKRITIEESAVKQLPVNIPNNFKLKTWEWTSNPPYLNRQKYHPKDKVYSTAHHLVACYYRKKPFRVGEVFLVSNTAATLQRFVSYAKTDFPLKITRR